jgi:hypothetical protein
MTQNEDQMAEATIGALENLETATSANRGVLAANSGQLSSCQTTGRKHFRVERVEGVAQSGTA